MFGKEIKVFHLVARQTLNFSFVLFFAADVRPIRFIRTVESVLHARVCFCLCERES